MFQLYQLSIHYGKVWLCDVFWNFAFLLYGKEMWLLRIIANSIASYEFHGYHKLRQCNSPGISQKVLVRAIVVICWTSWALWTTQSWWTSPSPLSNWLGCGTVQVPRLVYRLIQPGKQTNHANHPYWIWAKNFESMHPRKDYTDWGWYLASACLTCEIWNENVMQCL